MTSLSSSGDFNGDGFSDVLARNGSGALMLYRGDGSGGWRGATQIGSGWNSFSLIV